MKSRAGAKMRTVPGGYMCVSVGEADRIIVV